LANAEGKAIVPIVALAVVAALVASTVLVPREVTECRNGGSAEAKTSTEPPALGSLVSAGPPNWIESGQGRCATWQMCAPIARYLKKALEDVPKGERKAAVRLALFRLGAQEYGCDCFVKHGLVYWHLRDLDRRVIAWQIQSGSYDRERARILLDNRAIYRNVIDIREDNTVRIIALKRRRFS